MGTRYTITGNVPKGQVIDAKGSQGRYTRGSANYQTAKGLKSHQMCVAGKLEDKDFDNRADVRDAFRNATKECKKE